MVQDEQPAVVGSQPAFDGNYHPWLILLIFFWQIEQFSQHYKVSDESFTGCSPHPEHMGIFFSVAKGIFGCCLCFADAAESTEGQRLGQRSRSCGREPLV